MTAPLAGAGRWLNKTARNHIYAAGAGALYLAVTIKLFFFTDAVLVTALGAVYGAMSFSIASFIAVAIGLQKFGPQPGPGPFQARHHEVDDDRS